MYYNIIQQRHADPQDDMISDLIAVEVDRDGVATKLDDVEIAGFASMLGGAGAETVTKLVGNAVVTFGEHPDQWQMLLDDRSRIPAAVEELLRWEAPAQYLVRYSMKDVELHGTTIPAGKSGHAVRGCGQQGRAGILRRGELRHQPGPQPGAEPGSGVRSPQLSGCCAGSNGERAGLGQAAGLHAALRDRAARTEAGGHGQRHRLA